MLLTYIHIIIYIYIYYVYIYRERESIIVIIYCTCLGLKHVLWRAAQAVDTGLRGYSVPWRGVLHDMLLRLSINVICINTVVVSIITAIINYYYYHYYYYYYQ